MAFNGSPQKTINNFTAFNLSTEPLDGCGKRSTFLWSERSGWPRLTVFYGARESRGVIYAPMDLSTILFLLNDLIKMTEEPPGTKRVISCSNINYESSGEGAEREVREIASVFYGKDNDGQIWICLVNKLTESPHIKFLFEFNKFISLYDSSGNIITDKSLLSCLAAKSKCEALKKLYILACNNVNLSVQQQTTPNPAPEAFKAPSKIAVEDINF